MLMSQTCTYHIPRAWAVESTRNATPRNQLTTALLATKDGKSKKRGKVNGGMVGGSSSNSASTPPPRVTNKINIPIKQQIMWAKMSKSLMAASSSSCVSSNHVPKKYKKKETEKPVPEEYVEIDYHNTRPPALFVDGYNIVGHMRALGEFDRFDFASARDSLIGDLAILQSTTGWWIEVVFDAYKTGFPERQEVVDSVLVTYTSPQETADSYIERRFNELSNHGFTNMIVATDDQLLRSGAGALGKGYLSAELLREEIRIAYTSWDRFVEEMEEEVQRSKSPSIYVSAEAMAIINKFKEDYYAALSSNQEKEKKSLAEVSSDEENIPRKRLKKRELNLMTYAGQMEEREKERQKASLETGPKTVSNRDIGTVRKERRVILGDLDDEYLSLDDDIF